LNRKGLSSFCETEDLARESLEEFCPMPVSVEHEESGLMDVPAIRSGQDRCATATFRIGINPESEID
jgi:hypothetical protein